MTKIILNGCMGKLCTAIELLVHNSKNFEIAAGVDNKVNRPDKQTKAFPTYPSLLQCDIKADVLVDCSTPDAMPHLLEFGIKNKMPTVICTTGLSQKHISDIKEAAKTIPILQSANMSLGINLLINLVKKTAKLLTEANFDIEIVEKHHNQKIDAPSGTALLLADALSSSIASKMEYRYDRSKIRKKREADEIGIHSIRGGTIAGEHSVIFAGKSEIIEFNHQALSREIFAEGALKAVSFIKNKQLGFYTMQDLVEGA